MTATDPADYLKTFQGQCSLCGASDALMCKIFLITRRNISSKITSEVSIKRKGGIFLFSKITSSIKESKQERVDN